jgi:SulP family sulfate permease
MDLNRELKAAGLANIGSGLLGGVVGSHTIGATLLARQIGGKSRLTGLIVAGFYLVVLFAGLSLLAFFPRFVAGGALLFIGLPLITSWVYGGWFKLSRLDYGVMLLIASIVTTVGFMEGVVVGLIAAIALFVLKYSQVNVARHALSGVNYLSRQRRSPNQERLLRQAGDQIYLLQLQGFIFFGTAHTLLRQIRDQLDHPAGSDHPSGDRLSSDHPGGGGQPESRQATPIRFLVLDFRLVGGLDSSALLSFLKLKQLAQQRGLALVFTSLPASVVSQFEREGVLAEAQVFATLDEGMAWCETQVLEISQFRRRRTLPLAMQLEVFFAKRQSDIPTFLDYLEAVEVAAGDAVFRQGESPQGLYFLEYGQVSTQREGGAPGLAQHLETLGPGTIVGETDFYAQQPYRLSAIADTASRLHCLSATALKTMQQEHPQLAGQFSDCINALFSERLVQAQTEIELLLK